MIVVELFGPRWANEQPRSPATIAQLAESSLMKVRPAGATSLIVTLSASESPRFWTSRLKVWVPAAPAVTLSSVNVLVISRSTSSTTTSVSLSVSRSSSESTVARVGDRPGVGRGRHVVGHGDRGRAVRPEVGERAAQVAGHVIAQLAESSLMKVRPAGATSLIVTLSASESPRFWTTQAEGVGPGRAGGDAVVGERLGDLEIDVLDHDDACRCRCRGPRRRSTVALLVIVPALVVAGTS